MSLAEEGPKPLAARVKTLPDAPGVYLWKDEGGGILYVGKARSLRQRVRSYLQPPDRLDAKVRALMRRAADVEVIVTDTEVEALILESTLVKRHQPKYNIQLKDDKAFPYLRISWEEAYPRLLIARRPSHTGSRYFGPYPRVGAVHETIRLLRRVFPIRNCSNQKFKNVTRPCLEFHIGRCGGPCCGLVEQEAYRATMKRVERFLDGHSDEVVADLTNQLEDAAAALEFERAAELRDQVRAIQVLQEQQKVAGGAGRDLDAVHWAAAGNGAEVQVFMVRDGRLQGREGFRLEGLEGLADGSDGEVARAFLTQYYERSPHVPKEILVPVRPRDAALLERWLSDRRGGRVYIRVPERGEKKRLIEMVAENAVWARDEALRRQAVGERDREQALLEIQHSLGLPRRPERMECYDISNTQGTESVASMVVFVNGVPDKSQYRRFRIRTVVGANDFASMAEVLTRRFQHQALAAESDDPQLKRFAAWPDLVVVDGGKGQLSSAVAALAKIDVEVPIFGLAKQHEWLYAPESSDPIVLDMDSAGLKLLRHLRDEAHRFAITFHRQLRTRRNLRSLLDDVPGIGPARKRALLARFPNLDAVRAASVEDLIAVPGMTRRAAEALRSHFGPGEQPPDPVEKGDVGS
jgi:excinuclease ABC subunit C